MSHDFYKKKTGPVSLDNCAREPIHIPGAVQPHGCLVVCRAEDSVVVQASRSASMVRPNSQDIELDVSLESFVGEAAASVLGELLAAHPDGYEGVVELGGSRFSLVVHQHDGYFVLEFETEDDPGPLRADILRPRLSRLQASRGLQPLFDAATAEIRALTGFDRVMLYKFDAEWNGRVVSEARHEDLGTFLGLQYPAADIPEQARRLYTLNPIRVICDVDYEPSPLVPEENPVTGTPLDLSHVGIRSVSPIHCEYLRNMRVHASMSVSVLVDGRLWGLIACHHRTPLRVDVRVRGGCEVLGAVLSTAIPHALASDRQRKLALTESVLSRLEAEISSAQDAGDVLVGRAEQLCEAMEADGMAVVRDNRIDTWGLAPSERAIAELPKLLSGRFDDQGHFRTDHLAHDLPEAALGELGGLLATELGTRGSELLVVLFRAEQRQTVTWGSNPNKQLSFVDGTPRLSPEGSFQLWSETYGGRSVEWEEHTLRCLQSLRTRILEARSRQTLELLRLNEELRAATQAQDEFLATLSHELRNPLNAIVGWSRLLRDGTLPDSKVPHALDVIQRNSEVQLQLIEDLLDVSRIVNGKISIEPRTINLHEPIQAAIDTLEAAAAARKVTIVPALGESAFVRADLDRMQQVFWNLLSNAIKCSAEGQRIRVSVTRDDSSMVARIDDQGVGIAASDLPRLFDRFTQAEASKRAGGLGLGLSIVKGIVELHGGEVTAESPGPGFGATFSVRLPAAPVREVESEAPAHARDEAPAVLAGRTLLVIDDEPDAVALLEVLLESAGAQVRTAAGVQEGLAAISASPDSLDAIISDIGMPGGGGWAIAEAVRELDDGPRLIALTAYARAEDRVQAYRAGFEAHLRKPVDGEELVALLASMLDASGAR
ncbi:MAG: ATP-binding protein [Nannocystaceae bacterium]|nr:ATP-binding protein [bacterium]